MSKPDLLIRAAIRPDQMQALEAGFTLHRYDKAADPAALLQEVAPRIRGVVTTGSGPVGKDLTDALSQLEIVATSSVGTDHLDVADLKARGIQLVNTPDVLNDDVADLAMALVLMTHRRMVHADAWVRFGLWGRDGPFPLTTALSGRKLGILGLGGIGMAIAKRAAPFGLKVGYSGRSRKPVAYPYFSGALDLAHWADVLVLSLPASAQTNGIIDETVLQALGPAGILINVARGSVVNEPALIDALSRAIIAGAGLDVFAQEPTPAPELLELDQVILSPHHASGTVSTRDRMAQMVVDGVTAWFNGKSD